MSRETTTALPSPPPRAPETSPPPPPPVKRRGRPPKAGPRAPRPPKTTRPGAGLKGSVEAKRKASVILEVLGGLRSPTSGSAALEISVQRYYQLEVRALQGLVSALDAEPKRGASPAPEATLRRLTAERDRLQRELLRTQSLLRLAQRAGGLLSVETPDKARGKPPAGKRSKRPTVRARRAAANLRAEAGPREPEQPEATS